MTTEHDFTLILKSHPESFELTANVIWEAGCDDALLSQCDGKWSLEFTRAAPTREEAIQSAISDLRKVGIEAELAE